MSTCLTQTNEQFHNLEASFNWQQYTIASGVEDMVGGGNIEMQGMVNDTSAMADNSTTPEQENEDNTRLTTPVTASSSWRKMVREEPNNDRAS